MILPGVHTESKVTTGKETYKNPKTVILIICRDNKSYIALSLYYRSSQSAITNIKMTIPYTLFK